MRACGPGSVELPAGVGSFHGGDNAQARSSELMTGAASAACAARPRRRPVGC